MKYTAIKGIQAGNEYFTIMVKLKELEVLFPKLEEEILPERRAQRKLNQKRIPAIKRYIVENLDTYVFSALAGSVDGKVEFIAFSEEYPEVGLLEISDKATFLINDGQHRKTAIVEALKECPALADETIPVVLFKDMGLKRSQQMFTDLNKHAVKTSNSLAELYDSTDKIAAVTRKLLEQNEFIGKYTDREKDNLSMNSATLFTFNTFYKANKRIICGSKNDEINEKLIIDFWRMVVENIEQWTMLEKGELPKSRLRSEYLVCQSVVIEALGQLGNCFYLNGLDENVLIGLRDIDWHRNSKLWKKRCVKEKEKMVKNNVAVYLTANAIKSSLGLRLNDEEEKYENKFKRR